MGFVWVQVWDTEVAEPAVISLLNKIVSVTLSKQPCSASSSCDIVIPFQEQDTVLGNAIKPQSIISCPFSSSSHRMVPQLSYMHLGMDMSMLWRSYWQQGLIFTIKVK